MPVKRRLAKGRNRQLDLMQRWSLELGEDSRNPAFASEAEQREAWETHRDALMARKRAGMRPMAWWEYDSKEPRDRDVTECLQLYRMGELSEDEIAELMPFWRE